MDVIAVNKILYYGNDVKHYNINSKKNLDEWTQWYLDYKQNQIDNNINFCTERMNKWINEKKTLNGLYDFFNFAIYFSFSILKNELRKKNLLWKNVRWH